MSNVDWDEVFESLQNLSAACSRLREMLPSEWVYTRSLSLIEANADVIKALWTNDERKAPQCEPVADSLKGE